MRLTSPITWNAELVPLPRFWQQSFGERKGSICKFISSLLSLPGQASWAVSMRNGVWEGKGGGNGGMKDVNEIISALYGT